MAVGIGVSLTPKMRSKPPVGSDLESDSGERKKIERTGSFGWAYKETLEGLSSSPLFSLGSSPRKIPPL